MFSHRSPSTYGKPTKGGSGHLHSSTTSLASSPSSSSAGSSNGSAATHHHCSTSHHHSAPLKLGGGNPACRSGGSTHSLYSNASTSGLLSSAEKTHYHQHSLSHAHQHHVHHVGVGVGGSGGRAGGLVTGKRGKKPNWGTRERAGMSFLIVIAFFAVFGLIILTELLMIDERSHSSTSVFRHGGSFGTRLSDSMPDYDNVKDDYDLLEESILVDNKVGFAQIRDKKLNIQDANTGTGRLAGIMLGAGQTMDAALHGMSRGASGGKTTWPWGRMLGPQVEETLPRFTTGTQPRDGAWQIVNGTQFKFFVFSAYYDRRDSTRLVRIIGATRTRSPERVWCRYWYAPQPHNDSTAGASQARHQPRYTSATVTARIKVIRENWNLKYSACFILCPLRAAELEVPNFVSVVARLRAPPGNMLLLRNTDWDTDFVRPNKTDHGISANANANATTTTNADGSTRANAAAATPNMLQNLGEIPDKIAVCVKPFHFNYDQALYLMEYLEFYALLGVSHFTFYNHTMGPHASCVLQHYMKGDVPGNLTAWDVDQNATPSRTNKADGTVAANSNSNYNTINHSNNYNWRNVATTTATATAAPPTPAPSHYESTHYAKPTINILPWNLGMRSQKEIRTEGLFAALNDCLYRTMYRYKYLALVDLDEFIVPRHNDTLNELINSLNQQFRTRSTGAYYFQNAFFYLQFADDPLVTQTTAANGNLNARVRAALVTQRKTRRRAALNPQNQRSKYICKPETVIEAGNHFVWEFAPGRVPLKTPPSAAILQHYRVCEFGGNDCIKAPSVVDRTATRYVNRLVQRVEMVYNYLKEPCNLADLPQLPNEKQQKQQEAKTQQKAKQQTPPQQQQQQQQPETTVNSQKQQQHINEATKIRNQAINKTTQRHNNERASSASTMPQTAAAQATHTANTKATSAVAAKGQSAARRAKRKVIVFAQDDWGVPYAQVEYE